MSKQSRGLQVTVDHVTCAGIEQVVATLQVPVFMLGPGAWADVRAERGSYEATWQWLVDLAAQHECVIAVNLPTGADTSTTALIAPPGWSQERLAAVAAEVLPLLEDAFGDVAGTEGMPA